MVALALLAAAALAVVVVTWATTPSTARLRLTVGDGQVADATFPAVPGLPGSGSSQVLNAIASAGSTVVAVGSDTTRSAPRPLFIVSTDGGRRWELGQVMGPAGHQSSTGAVGRVAGGRGRWLAIAAQTVGPTGPDVTGMWVSTDGRMWQAVDSARLTPFRSQDRITDLTRTTTGFLVVGTTILQDGTAGPVAWVSPNGETWTRIDTGQISLPGRVRGIRAVAARGDQVVALADSRSGRSAPMLLRSDDGGHRWRRAVAAPAGVRPEPGALAATKKGFVLVPTRQRSRAGEVPVYCSPDGTRWSRCGLIHGLGREGTGVRALASSSAGIAALTEVAWERYAVHTSADGRRWTTRANLGRVPGTLRGLTITDSGLLVAGGDQRGAGDAENTPVLLTAKNGTSARAVPLKKIAGFNRLARDIGDVAAADGVFVAVGSANGDAAVWVSGNDGADWTAVEIRELHRRPGRQALSGVAHGPAGWLAVGSTTTDPAVTHPLLVTSPDGRSWRPGPTLEVTSDHFLLAPKVVAAGRQGYVLVGEDRGATGVLPALWFSADLRRFTRSTTTSMPAGGAGVRIADVAATADGFVAVGGSGTADWETGVVWVSDDGLNWTSLGRIVPPGSRSAGLRHVVATESALVVLGTATIRERARPFAAVSTDGGEHWEYDWLPLRDPADPAAVFDVTATSSGLVAVGSHGRAGQDDSVVWISVNGVDWQRRDLPRQGVGGAGTQRLDTVAVSGGRLVAIGRSAAHPDDHLTMWHGTLTED